METLVKQNSSKSMDRKIPDVHRHQDPVCLRQQVHWNNSKHPSKAQPWMPTYVKSWQSIIMKTLNVHRPLQRLDMSKRIRILHANEHTEPECLQEWSYKYPSTWPEHLPMWANETAMNLIHLSSLRAQGHKDLRRAAMWVPRRWFLHHLENTTQHSLHNWQFAHTIWQKSWQRNVHCRLIRKHSCKAHYVHNIVSLRGGNTEEAIVKKINTLIKKSNTTIILTIVIILVIFVTMVIEQCNSWPGVCVQ